VLGVRQFFLRVFVPVSYTILFFVKIVQCGIIVFRRLLVLRTLHWQGRHASQ
jgi:hypothetical protein